MAQPVRLIIDQGTDASFSVAVKGVEADSDCYVIMCIKQTSISLEYIDLLTTQNGRVTVDGCKLHFFLDAQTTARYPEGGLFYTIEYLPAGKRYVQLMYGELYVNPTTTASIADPAIAGGMALGYGKYEAQVVKNQANIRRNDTNINVLNDYMLEYTVTETDDGTDPSTQNKYNILVPPTRMPGKIPSCTCSSGTTDTTCSCTTPTVTSCSCSGTNEQVTTNTENIAALEDKVDTNVTNIAALEDKVDTNVTNISANASSIASLQNNLVTIEVTGTDDGSDPGLPEDVLITY